MKRWGTTMRTGLLFSMLLCVTGCISFDITTDPPGADIKARALHPDRGLILDLVIKEVKSLRAIDAALIARFEQGVLGGKGTAKRTGRELTFRGVPAYELVYSKDNGATVAVSRVFCANRRVYMLQLSGSAADMAKVTDLDEIMRFFFFISRPFFSR